MLTQLNIRNLAIIEQMNLDFSRGLTVLTGETGAGKSIIIDALGFALGDRSESGKVRNGEKRAEVTASFDLVKQPRVSKWLSEQELDSDEDCIIRRTVTDDGRSKGFINGRPVPMQTLKALGDQLIDLHGQHAHHSLLHPKEQQALLDAYANNAKLCTSVASQFREQRSLQQQLEALRNTNRDQADRIELLSYQVQELDDLAPEAGEWDQLDKEHRLLANAANIVEVTQATLFELRDQESGALQDRISHLSSNISDISEFNDGLKESHSLLTEAGIQIDEACSSLSHFLDQFGIDAERLEEVDQRLAELQRLSRKHHVEPNALPELHQQLHTDLDAIENADEHLDALEEKLNQAKVSFSASCKKLRSSRVKHAKTLQKKLVMVLAELGMSDAKITVQIDKLDLEEATAQGSERVEFLVSANPGSPAKPLNKVASGGELSRISLAIHLVTIDSGRIPTLIFDEVDVGIGGSVAEMVGKVLRELGEARQILCITHLAQVAALGHQHFQVAKSKQKGAIQTAIKPLDVKKRVEEIARMLGGKEVTTKATAHAKAMLQTSQNN